ncbi:hypothetical protein ACH4E7_44880 [Kitasatospora sp. NPDC018058]
MKRAGSHSKKPENVRRSFKPPPEAIAEVTGQPVADSRFLHPAAE